MNLRFVQSGGDEQAPHDDDDLLFTEQKTYGSTEANQSLVLLPGLTVRVFVSSANQVGEAARQTSFEGATNPPWYLYITNVKIEIEQKRKKRLCDRRNKKVTCCRQPNK